jgi:hypothetical protein
LEHWTHAKRSHELRDWQTSSLQIVCSNKDGNAPSVVIFGTESVSAKTCVGKMSGWMKRDRVIVQIRSSIETTIRQFSL